MTNTDTTTTHPLPPIKALKQQAKRLRECLAQDGDFISHSEALELLAHQHGHKDWNTLYAAIGNRPAVQQFIPGARVSGRYLSQVFSGEIIGATRLSTDRIRLTIAFDEAVDVVRFDSFSAFRQRVSCTVDKYGESAEKTSDGQPQMIIAET